MPLRLGTKQEGFALLGTTNIDKAYLGTTLVFQQGFVRTLTGIPPLITTKATIGKDLMNYKIYGNTVQRILPKGYTQVLGIRAGQGAYIDIATTIGTGDSFEYSYSVSTGTSALQWGYRGTSSYDSANSFSGTFSSGGRLIVYANSSSAVTYTTTAELLGVNTRLDFKYDGDTKTASIPGYTFDKSTGFAPDIEPPQNHFVLNGIYITNTNSYSSSTAGNIIYRFKSAECDIYPCVRDSDGAVGLYDVKRNVFIPPTKGTFTVVTGNVYPTPTAPIEIESVGDRSKNLLPKGTSTTSRGITYTVLDDGRVRITGTATSTSFWGAPVYLPAGNYAVGGCPSGGGTSTYRLDVRESVEGTVIGGVDSGSGATLTISTARTCYLNIRVASRYVCPESGLVLSPMVASGSTPLPYEPYGYQIPIRTNGLPKEYRQVEYLENTGTQHIDTGVIGNCVVEMDAQGTAEGSYSQVVVGCDSPVGNFFGKYSTSTYWSLVPNQNLSTSYTSRANLTITFTSSGITATDGSSTTSGTGTPNRTLPYWLFACNRSNAGSHFYAQAKIYSAKFTQNGQLVRNFIPAVRTADSKPGMYDTVTGQFYTNAGTGEFAVGATVSAITLAQPLRRIVAGSTTYTDYSDYKSQKVYRQCGVKVLDGTEAWVLSQTNPKRFYLVLPANTYKRESFTPICTHFKGHASTTGTSGLSPNEISFYYNSATSPSQELYVYADIEVSTANDFKQWLAQQYAAGTPVTIVYPLATPTEESVSLPALPTERGATTTVEVATEVVPSSVEIVYRGR